ncbi:MAG: 50S ribosomal protein L4 [Candidatus Dadabacteria bacterium]|nr:MAG: 50S ribosomal protein L4 [Candidatus Dadabacteria bacterium]
MEIKCKIIDETGKEKGELQLNPAVFGARVSGGTVHQVVRWQLAKRRSGTHSTLTRGMKKGGGSKPWRQKGLGRARAGSRNSPVWVGGGVAHGPQPRDYEFKIPKGIRKKALCGVISHRVHRGRFVVVDKVGIKEGKTKEMVSFLEKAGLPKSTLIVGDEDLSLVERSARNIKGVDVISVNGVNVYDVLRHQYVVVCREALQRLEDRLA